MLAAVIGMGVLIVAGVIAIAWRLAYLASLPGGATGFAPELFLDLPAGAEIRALSLDGKRLAVSYMAPSGSGIAVIDLESGRAVSRVTTRAK